MRYIAVFLLLLNIGYFAWSQLRPPLPAAPAAPPARALLNNGLMLVSEFRQQSAEQELLNVEASRVCYFVTGFFSVDDATSFIVLSEEMGLAARLSLGGEPLDPQYRVFLPPASSRSIASITLNGLSERIQASGLEVETYIITRGMLENAIALGVFPQLEEAGRVRQQVRELGYNVEMEEIPQSTGEVRVLLRSLDSIIIETPQWLDLTADRPELQRTENLCETIAQGPQFP